MRCLRDTHRATSVGLAPHISALQAHRLINIFPPHHIYESNHIDSLTPWLNLLTYSDHNLCCHFNWQSLQEREISCLLRKLSIQVSPCRSLKSLTEKWQTKIPHHSLAGSHLHLRLKVHLRDYDPTHLNGTRELALPEVALTIRLEV